MTQQYTCCLQDLLNDWESQGSRVQELNKTGSELESLIIDITAPQSKTGKSKGGGAVKHDHFFNSHSVCMTYFPHESIRGEIQMMKVGRKTSPQSLRNHLNREKHRIEKQTQGSREGDSIEQFIIKSVIIICDYKFKDCHRNSDELQSSKIVLLLACFEIVKGFKQCGKLTIKCRQIQQKHKLSSQ